jgi:ABC-2 type transport system permease protein
LQSSQGDLLLMTYLSASNALGIQMFLVPLQTMRAIAEEKRSGTFEMLVTAPLRDHEVVLAKFLALTLWNATIWLVIPFYGWIMKMSGGLPDFGPVLVSYFGVVTTGALLISLGLLASSMTRHVSLAGLLGVVFCIALTLLPGLWSSIPEEWQTLRSVLAHGDLGVQMDTAGRGILDVVHLAYRLSFTGFFLLVTVRVLEVRKWA